MNKLGLGGRPGQGSFLFADPANEAAALLEAAHASEQRALTALRERGNGAGQTNAHKEITSEGGG
jgi:ubiquinol-cytochrome c reductase cytochrome b subunit